MVNSIELNSGKDDEYLTENQRKEIVESFFNTPKKRDWLVSYTGADKAFEDSPPMTFNNFLLQKWLVAVNTLVDLNCYRSLAAINKAIDIYESHHIPSSLYSLIDASDERMCRFFIRQLRVEPYSSHYLISLNRSIYKILIDAIGDWFVYLPQKKLFIESCSHNFSLVYHKTQHFDWINKANENQLRWSMNYLQNKDKFSPCRMPRNKKELFNCIVEELDLILLEQLNQPESQIVGTDIRIPKEDFILKMKASWQKQNQRTNSKSETYTLNKSQSSKLKTLSEQNMLTTGKMLTKLLDDEIQRRKMINGNGRKNKLNKS